MGQFVYNALSALQEIFVCSDCVFWCGRCIEPTLVGKKSINKVASSPACDKFPKRIGS